MKSSKYPVLISIIAVILIVGIVVWNLPSAKRARKSLVSNTVGLEREIIWTGHDGTVKKWNVRTKVFTEDGMTRFFDEDGDVIILMPGICIEEK
jgi:hypothetical protein